MLINTGAPRSIKGHAVSGGLFSLMVAGVSNYAKYKKGEIDKNEAIKQTTKATLRGAAITAAAIGAANALGSNNQTPTRIAIETLTFVAAGVAAAYGINQVFKENTEILSLEHQKGEDDE